jgi:hypothetical protein
VDHEDVKMRLFTQSLSGEVRKWFKALQAASIPNFAAFETSFIARWGDKKNPLQLLTQYNNMKRVSEEMVQEFSALFHEGLQLNSLQKSSHLPGLCNFDTPTLLTMISPCC